MNPGSVKDFSFRMLLLNRLLSSSTFQGLSDFFFVLMEALNKISRVLGKLLFKYYDRLLIGSAAYSISQP